MLNSYSRYSISPSYALCSALVPYTTLFRSEVEGCWARITDRVWEHKGVSLLSTPDLCAADKDQLLLALDPLIGIEVHLDADQRVDRKSTRLNSSHLGISYAVFCLKKKRNKI